MIITISMCLGALVTLALLDLARRARRASFKRRQRRKGMEKFRRHFRNNPSAYSQFRTR